MWAVRVDSGSEDKEKALWVRVEGYVSYGRGRQVILDLAHEVAFECRRLRIGRVRCLGL
jgi:hypothetical protein